jgi:hypothetical protein
VTGKLLDASIIEHHIYCDPILAHVVNRLAAETTLEAEIGVALGHGLDAGIAT